jgi:hypothetical protein
MTILKGAGDVVYIVFANSNIMDVRTKIFAQF